MIRKIALALAVVAGSTLLASETLASGYGISAPLVQRQRIVQRQGILGRFRQRNVVQQQVVAPVYAQQFAVQKQVVQQAYVAPIVQQVKVKQFVAQPVYAAPVVVQPFVAVEPQLQFKIERQSACVSGVCPLQQLNSYSPTLPQCQ